MTLPGNIRMQISKLLAKAAFNGLMLFLPLVAAATVSYDLYEKGFGSPFASLFSAFVGLYVGFMVIWRMLCWADDLASHVNRVNARAAVRLRAVKRALMDWDVASVSHA
jgi:hypothetical protein